jgi:hypothetical protein
VNILFIHRNIAKVISFCFLALVLSGCGCPYTEKDVAIPDMLKGAMLLTEQDAYLAIGNDPECCTSPTKAVRVLRDINNEIVDNATIMNTTIGRAYFERQGRKVEPLPKGKRFTVARIIAQTKDGIPTIDSSPGPTNYLILSDETGTLYKLAVVSLGQGLLDADLNAQL